MFLKTVMERNQPLVRLGSEWQQNGVILPATYLLDYDKILENAGSIKRHIPVAALLEPMIPLVRK